MSGFLVDTDVISELIKARPEPGLLRWIEQTDEHVLYLSVLTLGEIRKGIAALPSSARRARIETWLETGLRPRFAGRILPVDEAVADRWGWLTARALKAGFPLPVIDGLLAATALHRNLTFVTRDTRSVAATGVPLLNPWQP